MDMGFLFLHSNGKKSPLKKILCQSSFCHRMFLWEPRVVTSDAILKVTCGVALPQVI